MKTKFSFSGIFLTAFLFLCSCGNRDNDLQQNVNDVLKSSPALFATVENGEVTLNGMVDNGIIAIAAEESLSKINGIKKINNKVKIVSSEANDDLLSLGIQQLLQSHQEMKYRLENGILYISGQLSFSDWANIKSALENLQVTKIISSIILK
jgi:hyperosmotically inducible periplasmic protein